MQRNRSQRAFSAGGVIFRQGHTALPDPGAQKASAVDTRTDEIEVVLVGRSPSGIWALPKGTPRKGETVEQVALREVNEETGLQTRILANIGSIHYSFVRNTMRYEKEVRYFLMEPVGGDISLHDHEYDEVRWFPLAEAYQRLTYESDSHILRQAEGLVRKRASRRNAS
ncbi:MAG TPA: NUDIX hydrolase [Ktedonobacterales bacterium]|jgi:8-oxo-dGTP pyrophosphatase MutT (NUDIX family)